MRRSFEKISSTVLRTFKTLLTVDLLSPVTFEEKMVRFFLNSYDDYKLGDSVTIDRDEVTAQLHEYTNSISKRLHPSRKNVDGGLYVGVTGVSYMYYYLSKNTLLSDNKSVYLEKSIEYLTPALDTSAGDKTSFLLGDAGTYALATVLFNETGDEKSADMLKAYKSLYTQYLNPNFLKCGGDEYFVGRAGYLAGALWMSRELKSPVFTNEELYKLCDVIVESGREYSMKQQSPCPLMFHYYNTEYLGAAHGMSFILQMLLCVPGYLKFNKAADNPESLFEGTAGTVCFLADLLVPDKAEFPFQDVFSSYSF